MPSIIQYALALEAIGNTASCVPCIFSPHKIYAAISESPASSIDSASTVALVQAIGVIMGSYTTPLLECLPDGPHAAERRKLTYRMLASADVFIIPIFLLKAREARKAREAGRIGIKEQFYRTGALNMGCVFLWRLWVLFVRPAWLAGNYKKTSRKNQ